MLGFEDGRMASILSEVEDRVNQLRDQIGEEGNRGFKGKKKV